MAQGLYPTLARGEPVQFRTIQRADLLVAITAPPAVILATVNGKLTILVIALASVTAIRAMFIRSVVVAHRAALGQSSGSRRRLATVHDLGAHRGMRDSVEIGAGDRR